MGKKKRTKKKPAMNKQTAVNLAAAWYKPDQWQQLREISEDRDQLEETYAEWLVMAENALRNFAAQGISLTKVEVDADELLAWSRERGLPVNGVTRSHFAAWLLKEKEKKEN